MKFDEYRRQFREFLESMQEETDRKNPDYSAGENDAMANYHIAARFAGVEPFQAWMVLFMKHVCAISRYSRTGKTSSEEIRHRLKDAATYCALGTALLNDMAASVADDDDGEAEHEVDSPEEKLHRIVATRGNAFFPEIASALVDVLKSTVERCRWKTDTNIRDAIRHFETIDPDVVVALRWAVSALEASESTFISVVNNMLLTRIDEAASALKEVKS